MSRRAPIANGLSDGFSDADGLSPLRPQGLQQENYSASIQTPESRIPPTLRLDLPSNPQRWLSINAVLKLVSEHCRKNRVRDERKHSSITHDT